MNICFSYLYRDAGNYKQWGEVVFRNPEGLSSSDIDSRLRAAFFQTDLFIARQIGVPECFLYAEGEATEDDISFHEFDAVAETENAATDAGKRSVAEFILEVERVAAAGWKVTTPV